MTAKLSVIFYILLCLEVGLVLTLLPWISPLGLGDWGDNYFLCSLVSRDNPLYLAVSSGWVRGAVTGLGLLNIGVAVWEIVHFQRTVSALENAPAKPPAQTKDDAQPPTADHLPDNERRDQRDHWTAQ